MYSVDRRELAPRTCEAGSLLGGDLLFAEKLSDRVVTK